MARIADDDIDAGSDGVVVERKIIPRRRNMSVLALVIVLAFAATCAVVFFGDRLGLHTPPPANVVVTPSPPTPAP